MRMSDGRETWSRLLNWDKGQTPAERLAAIILANEGYRNVDPSHPLGGKDGLKDLVLSSGGKPWIGAVYFPRGQQSFSVIKEKFIHDLEGVTKNNAMGMVFVTNQELRLSERKILCDSDPKIDVQIYHLERIASILNLPSSYGIRMEFLDIEMTKEEQLAYFANQDEKIEKIEAALKQLTIGLEEYKIAQRSTVTPEEFEEEIRSLDQISSAEEEFFEKIWFDRHMTLKYKIEQENTMVDPDIWAGALESERKMIDKYGEKNLGPYSDFEWGMLNGKLSALRWVLGCDWDMLDT